MKSTLSLVRSLPLTHVIWVRGKLRTRERVDFILKAIGQGQSWGFTSITLPLPAGNDTVPISMCRWYVR